MYIYIYIDMLLYMGVYAYMYIHMCIDMCICKYIYIYIYMYYVCVYVYVLSHMSGPRALRIIILNSDASYQLFATPMSAAAEPKVVYSTWEVQPAGPSRV